MFGTNKSSIIKLTILALLLIPSVVSASDNYKFRVEDPLVGTSILDINTEFWEPSHDSKCGSGGYTIDENGFTLSGCLSYLGLIPQKWMFSGDFEITVFVANGNGGTPRGHFTVHELIDDCNTYGPKWYGLWGGGHAGPNRGDAHYMASGESAYYLIKKVDETITIYRGDSTSVDESSEIVIQTTVTDPEGKYKVYVGVGWPNRNTFRLKDFTLETDNIDSCTPGTEPPSEWITDTTPPTTEASLSGTLGDNDWYLSDVDIILDAVDKGSENGGDSFDRTGLQFEYLFEEGSGNVVHDSSDYQRHLSGSGTFVWETDGQGNSYINSTTTTITSGFRFGGTDSSSFLNGYHTLESWFNLNSIPTSGYSYIVAKTICTKGGTYIIYNWAEKKFIFDYYDVSAYRWHRLTSEVIDLEPGKWYHVVATHDSTGAYLYLDAQMVASNSDSTLFKEYGNGLVRLGDDYCDSQNFLPGSLDEVRSYDRPMSPEEVSEHYESRVEGTPSGVAATYYSLDGGLYVEGSSLTVTEEGEHTLSYYSVDNAGNEEEPKSVSFKIDKTAPVVSIASPLAAGYEHSASVDVAFSAADDVSGVMSTVVYLDGSLYESNTIDLMYLALGTHTLTVDSENYAGLVSTDSVEFEVAATIDSLPIVKDRLYEMGEIDNKGIMTSLNKKLAAAKKKIDSGQNKAAVNILEAFISEVEAQHGKHISVFAADLLKADAEYLIATL